MLDNKSTLLKGQEVLDQEEKEISKARERRQTEIWKFEKKFPNIPFYTLELYGHPIHSHKVSLYIASKTWVAEKMESAETFRDKYVRPEARKMIRDIAKTCPLAKINIIMNAHPVDNCLILYNLIVVSFEAVGPDRELNYLVRASNGYGLVPLTELS